MSQLDITSVNGRQVWDSRGRPTIEVEIHLSNGAIGRAIAPAGASTGSGEALDLRDGGTAFGGYGVTRALAGLREEIVPALTGLPADQQALVDDTLESLDGTEQLSRLGGNALIATSLAVAHAAASGRDEPLWHYFSDGTPPLIPVPEIQIYGGGAHAAGAMDLQDFMVVPFGASSFREALEWVAEIYLAAGKIVSDRGVSVGVADEGGYWPVFESNEKALDALLASIETAGFNPETQVGMSIDVAANQFYRDGAYVLKAEGRALSTEEWYDQVAGWVKAYPIAMIEDPFTEDDHESHRKFTSEFRNKVQIVGDDLLVTNKTNVDSAVANSTCTALLCKPNQAGTLTRTKNAFEAAKSAGLGTIVSARSGESEDTTIAHLSVGWASGQFKVGSFTRSERMAKWNEMLRIEESLGTNAKYAGGAVLGLN
ncbi:phosphopyruvate hydratase [Hyphomonas sp.]|uniref:phosphopyruvate hydratase n=1 Tax=Hyphomonas sp. TaxID=87 RepID=UPI001D28E07C|nr:phosphopyruvate hydratase [Hyphomonas sp.]